MEPLNEGPLPDMKPAHIGQALILLALVVIALMLAVESDDTRPDLGESLCGSRHFQVIDRPSVFGIEQWNKRLYAFLDDGWQVVGWIDKQGQDPPVLVLKKPCEDAE